VCVSSELEEILKISERIAVTAGGQFAGEVACARAVFKANCDKMRGRLFGEGGNLWSKHTILRQGGPPLLLFRLLLYGLSSAASLRTSARATRLTVVTNERNCCIALAR
jgi:hypothetical protein